MTADRPELHELLKKKFIPVIRAVAFRGSMPHFRRFRGDALELLSIRFSRDTPSFFLEVARCDLIHLKNEDGTPQWPGNATAWGVAMTRIGPHARIRNPACAGETSEFPGWVMAQDGIAMRAADGERAVREAVAAMPGLQAWFAKVAVLNSAP